MNASSRVYFDLCDEGDLPLSRAQRIGGMAVLIGLEVGLIALVAVTFFAQP